MNNQITTMRDVFIEKLYLEMFHDKNIFFLAADFGSPKLDKLRSEFSDRFINVGIAEQNLINVATGLALEGYAVFAYAIAPFLTMRAFEQIRNNLSLLSKNKQVNVNLIGVGAGLSYDVSGPSHHCIEDISIMRSLPNISIFSPSDSKLCEMFVDYSLKTKVPKYLRFDGKPQPEIYGECIDLNLENGFYELVKGNDLCLVATGYMTQKALKVVKKLKEKKISVGLIDFFMLRPFDEKLLYEKLNKYKYLITLEEAFITKGGLDSIILNISNKYNLKVVIKQMGFKDEYVFDVGGREYLHKLNGLDEESIISNIKKYLK